MACVDVPALSLQLLLRREPRWRRRPVAVVAEDDPLSPLLEVNECARRLGILPGLRYAAGLSIDSRLCAGTVAPDELAAALDDLLRLLLRFSPEVEPAGAELQQPGVFWLNAAGLQLVHGPLPEWAAAIVGALRARRFAATVVVGFTRFGVYSLARGSSGVRVFDSPRVEGEAAGRVPLARLGIDPGLRDDLDRLGISTVSDFLALPAAGLRARFGPAVARLHELAGDRLFAPLQPSIPADPCRAEHRLDDPETDAWRLLFLIKRIVHPLLGRLAEKQLGVAEVVLDLRLADRRRHEERLRPATPTLDAVLLMELIRLRLEHVSLAAGVEDVVIELVAADAPPEALALFREHPRRDAKAGLRALARLRADFGDTAVRRAVLRDGHLPVASFSWQPAVDFPFPEPSATREMRVVRRLLRRPRQLPGDPRQLRAARPRGSYRISGGWWRREVRRIYHFVETGGGEVLWVYFDQLRRNWYLQGWVE